MVEWLPGTMVNNVEDPIKLTDDELTASLYFGMPKRWVDVYKQVSNRYNTDTFDDLVKFFTDRETDKTKGRSSSQWLDDKLAQQAPETSYDTVPHNTHHVYGIKQRPLSTDITRQRSAFSPYGMQRPEAHARFRGALKSGRYSNGRKGQYGYRGRYNSNGRGNTRYSPWNKVNGQWKRPQWSSNQPNSGRNSANGKSNVAFANGHAVNVAYAPNDPLFAASHAKAPVANATKLRGTVQRESDSVNNRPSKKAKKKIFANLAHIIDYLHDTNDNSPVIQPTPVRVFHAYYGPTHHQLKSRNRDPNDEVYYGGDSENEDLLQFLEHNDADDNDSDSDDMSQEYVTTPIVRGREPFAEAADDSNDDSDDDIPEPPKLVSMVHAQVKVETVTSPMEADTPTTTGKWFGDVHDEDGRTDFKKCFSEIDAVDRVSSYHESQPVEVKSTDAKLAQTAIKRESENVDEPDSEVRKMAARVNDSQEQRYLFGPTNKGYMLKKKLESLMATVDNEKVVAVNSTNELNLLMQGIDTNGSLFANTGDTKVMIASHVFDNFYACSKPRYNDGRYEAEMVDKEWPGQFIGYKSTTHISFHEHWEGPWARAKQQLTRDQGAYGPVNFLRTFDPEELFKAKQWQHKVIMEADEPEPWMEHCEFFSSNFANLNIHPARKQVLGEWRHKDPKLAFEIYKPLWYAYGTMHSHHPSTGQRMRYRGENGWDHMHMMEKVVAPPMPRISLAEALQYTDPDEDNRYTGEPHFLDNNGADDERKQSYRSRSFDYMEYPMYLDRFEHPTLKGIIYCGAAARFLQQLRKDCAIWLLSEMEGKYIADPDDIERAQKLTQQFKIVEREFFEVTFGNICLHPERLAMLQNLRKVNPQLAYEVWKAFWHAYGTMDSHEYNSGNIKMNRRAHPNYGNKVYPIVKPAPSQLSLEEALAMTEPKKAPEDILMTQATANTKEEDKKLRID
jgi:hypothetical protein